MILKEKWITECMYPKFHRFGIRRVLGSNLAEPGEPRPRPMPTPTTTPLSGWVLICAVSAEPSALLAPCLFVGVALGREHIRSGQGYAGRHRFGLRWCSVFRFAPTLNTIRPSLRIRPPPLPPSLLCPLGRLTDRAVFGTATQSQAYLCGVGKALRLACSLLAPCLFVGVAPRSGHIRLGQATQGGTRFGLMVVQRSGFAQH